MCDIGGSLDCSDLRLITEVEMAIKIRIETPIAFALTLTVCLVLFFYCWRIRKLRHRLTGSVQVSALPIADTVPVETGITKEVIATFPTVKAHELKDDDIKEGCPICLAEYADVEVLRKLPLCGHVFHIRCVDSWLENQVTCPVCRIVLTGAVFSHNSKLVNRVQRATTTQVPAWVLVNRPLPLPSAIAEEPRSSDGSGVSPLLEHQCTGWGAVYLENSNAALAIQTKECIHHASISERWMTESFVFGMSSSSGSEAIHQSPRRHASWIMDLKQQPMQQQLQQQLQMMDLEWEHCADDEVVESSRVTPFRPLTMSPERCSFEFLPIVTGPGAKHSY